MLIVHDANLKIQHVIYEHPSDYDKVLDKTGARWLRTAKRYALADLALGRHPVTGKRVLTVKAEIVDLVAASAAE
ncbi:MAG: hypothetical protein WAN43_16150 [Rhodomicrobium sp.]